MEEKEKEKLEFVSQTNRRNYREGGTRRSKVRKFEKEERTIADVFGKLTSNFLKPIPYFEVQRRLGNNHYHDEMVEAIKKYHHLLPDSIEVEKKASPEEVFSQIINTAYDTIVRESGEKSGFQFNSGKLIRLDAYEDLEDSINYVSIETFNRIKVDYPVAFELIQDLLCLLSKHTGIHLPMEFRSEERYMYEMFQEDVYNQEAELESAEGVEKEDLQNSIDSMLEIINEYDEVEVMIIKILKRKITCKGFNRKVGKFSPKDILEKEIKDWLVKGIQVLKCNLTIQSFEHLPETFGNFNTDGAPIYPSIYNRFIWCDNDDLFEYMDNHLNEQYGEYGAVPYFHSYEFDKKEPRPDFPIILNRFLDDGFLLTKLITLIYGY